MITLDSTNFSETISSDKLTLVDFTASWCGPCRMMAPILEGLAKEIEDITFFKLDIDQSAAIAHKYGVTGVPTLLIFQNGEPIASHVGLVSKNALKDGLLKLAERNKDDQSNGRNKDN